MAENNQTDSLIFKLLYPSEERHVLLSRPLTQNHKFSSKLSAHGPWRNNSIFEETAKLEREEAAMRRRADRLDALSREVEADLAAVGRLQARVRRKQKRLAAFLLRTAAALTLQAAWRGRRGRRRARGFCEQRAARRIQTAWAHRCRRRKEVFAAVVVQAWCRGRLARRAARRRRALRRCQARARGWLARRAYAQLRAAMDAAAALAVLYVELALHRVVETYNCRRRAARTIQTAWRTHSRRSAARRRRLRRIRRQMQRKGIRLKDAHAHGASDDDEGGGGGGSRPGSAVAGDGGGGGGNPASTPPRRHRRRSGPVGHTSMSQPTTPQYQQHQTLRGNQWGDSAPRTAGSRKQSGAGGALTSPGKMHRRPISHEANGGPWAKTTRRPRRRQLHTPVLESNPRPFRPSLAGEDAGGTVWDRMQKVDAGPVTLKEAIEELIKTKHRSASPESHDELQQGIHRPTATSDPTRLLAGLRPTDEQLAAREAKALAEAAAARRHRRPSRPWHAAAAAPPRSPPPPSSSSRLRGRPAAPPPRLCPPPGGGATEAAAAPTPVDRWAPGQRGEEAGRTVPNSRRGSFASSNTMPPTDQRAFLLSGGAEDWEGSKARLPVVKTGATEKKRGSWSMTEKRPFFDSKELSTGILLRDRSKEPRPPSSGSQKDFQTFIRMRSRTVSSSADTECYDGGQAPHHRAPSAASAPRRASLGERSPPPRPSSREGRASLAAAAAPAVVLDWGALRRRATPPAGARRPTLEKLHSVFASEEPGNIRENIKQQNEYIGKNNGNGAVDRSGEGAKPPSTATNNTAVVGKNDENQEQGKQHCSRGARVRTADFESTYFDDCLEDSSDAAFFEKSRFHHS